MFKQVLNCSVLESSLVLSLPKLQHLLSRVSIESVLLVVLFFYCLNAVLLASVFLQDDLCLVHIINAKIASLTDGFFFSFVCFTLRGVRERYSFTWKDAVLLLLPVLSDLSLSSPRIKGKLKVLVICVQQLHL